MAPEAFKGAGEYEKEKKISRKMKNIQHVLGSKGKCRIPAKIDMSMVNRLPSEIIIDIISRLPTDSILECRQVCKTWRNLIRHPSLAHMHLRRNGNIYPCHSSAIGAKVGFGFLNEFRILTPKIKYMLYYGEYDGQPNTKLRRLNQPSHDCLSIAGSLPHMNSFVSLKALGEKCRCRKRYAVNPAP
ncbi:hypothetical protein C5167_021108 [Papaver somniferum]|uniref:F-box domain-containing protein n=1 Tax=Papaver somniferum TaxID=3469 RepID=A0A4Y7IYU6_PAPSO|nr:hypothetical protein C5167_021108 [Papaver somniferum]